MKFKFIVVFMLTSISAFSQIEATTTDGKKVLLNSNGTWSYKNETSSKTDNLTVCDSLVEMITDKVSGESYLTMKKSLLISKDEKNGFLVWMSKSKQGNLIIRFKIYGAGSCVEKDTKINILYRDGSRQELNANNDFNCEQTAVVYFGGVFGKTKIQDEFKLKEIETLRIWTSKSYHQEDFTKENSIEFRNLVNCFTK